MSRTPNKKDPAGKPDGQQVLQEPEHSGSTPSGTDASETKPQATHPATRQAQLAHELKTPISAIAAAADIMRNEQFGPLGNDKYKAYAVDIHASAIFTLAVIDRLLNTQRTAQSTAGRIEISQVDLKELANEVVSAMQPLAQAGGITLSGPADTSSSQMQGPTVRADEISLKQIATNLLANSIKFTNRGGHVALSLSEIPDGGASIIVTDDGAGMTAAQIESALSGETVPTIASTEGRRGMGMGLPLVRNLATANGANLTITSDGPGMGTRVEIQFPPARQHP